MKARPLGEPSFFIKFVHVFFPEKRPEQADQLQPESNAFYKCNGHYCVPGRYYL